MTLKNFIKYNKQIYAVYYYTGSFLLSILKLFLKPNKKLILFVSSGGKSMMDSPKMLYDLMCKDTRFEEYELAWAFRNPNSFKIERGIKLKIDSYKYFKYAIQSRVWITNVTVSRGLKFSGINTIMFNSWHGTPIKHVGKDVIKNKETFTSREEGKTDTIMVAQSKYESSIFTRAFNVPKEKIKVIGQPRNDSLLEYNNKNTIDTIKKKLNIPNEKKLILYAPTFRDYERESGGTIVLTPPIDWVKWKKRLSDKFVVLFRAHPAVLRVMNVAEDDFVRNVSSYSNLNELLVITDILVSDYSGILIDYSILERPMLCFAYDYDEYKAKRGLYFDIRKELQTENIDNEDKLLDAITNMDESARISVSKMVKGKFVEEYGSATSRMLDLIYDNIK